MSMYPDYGARTIRSKLTVELNRPGQWRQKGSEYIGPENPLASQWVIDEFDHTEAEKEKAQEQYESWLFNEMCWTAGPPAARREILRLRELLETNRWLHLEVAPEVWPFALIIGDAVVNWRDAYINKRLTEEL